MIGAKVDFEWKITDLIKISNLLIKELILDFIILT